MLESISVSNFKSFNSPALAEFGPKWTVVVGQNNSGKSSLLKACDPVRCSSSPYRGLSTDPKIPSNRYSIVRFKFFMPGEQLNQLLLEREWIVPIACDQVVTSGILPREEQVQAFFDEIVSSGGLHVSGEYQPGPGLILDVVSSHQGVQIFPGNSYARLEPRVAERKCVVSDSGYIDNISSYAHLSIEYLRQSIFAFSAERLSIGPSPMDANLQLESNASNLARVVLRLREQKHRFEDYVSAVNEVFPAITDVVPTVIDNKQVDIRISMHDPKLNRGDLNFALRDCGTGVSQVLAILFVAMTSDYPRTIIIDEPNSFLHPGAAKKLINILKRFDKNQYIIATHSPELIATIQPDSLLHVQWKPTGSQITKFNTSDLERIDDLLRDVGSNLSDVFGVDKVVWVEGKTEENCFPKLLKNSHVNSLGLKFLAVRSVDELRAKDKMAIVEIYESISQSRSFLPGASAYSFDSEGLTQPQKDSLARMAPGRVHFLPRRMFENYLLVPRAISEVLKKEGFAITERQVLDWFIESGGRKDYLAESYWKEDLLDLDWLKHVHGAKLLEDCFENLSEKRLEYRKTKHGSMLVDCMEELIPESLNELRDYVVRLCSTESRND